MFVLLFMFVFTVFTISSTYGCADTHNLIDHADVNEKERITFITCQSGLINMYKEKGQHYACIKAIDRIAGHCSDTTVSSTRQWWTGVFSDLYKVSEVVIYNTAAAIKQNSLLNFEILGDEGEPCAQYNEKTTFARKKFVCNTVTRRITIRLRKIENLELCEVEAYGRLYVNPSKDRIKFKTCKTSSTYNGDQGKNYACTKAMDGVAGKCLDKTVSVTNKGKEWWKGVFPDLYQVTNVIIYNRANQIFANRLINFEILGDDGELCAEYNKKTTFGRKMFVCNTVTNSITIRLKENNYLELCEVIAYGSRNIIESSKDKIMFKGCETSSTYTGDKGRDYACTKAMDGHAGKCSDKTVSVSNHGKQWWKGIFSQKFKVTHVVIYNRANQIHANRLNNFEILGDDGKPCAKYNKQTAFKRKKFACNTVTNSITIRLKTSNFLELCEVIAYGTRYK